MDKRRRPERTQQRRPTHAPRREDSGPSYEPVHLPNDVVEELHATARPGKGEILVKVFADAAAAFAADDYGEAIRLAEQAKHIALRAPAARELLGLAYYRQGQWSEAARELGTFRRLSGSKEQNPVLADSFRALGKPERAIALCDEVRSGDVPDPIYYEAQIVGAGAAADSGDLDGAIARLERLDLNPEVADAHHLRAWYVLGDLLARKGKFTQARDLFEAVAAADPDVTDAPERAAKLRR
jgi:uncharacterized protein HemY